MTRIIHADPVSLTPGTRLGPYDIVALLGVGGMGEVYRATDTNLKRAVAIKVLPASVATDPERLSRFQREAEVLAALNHPHIAQIYGLEKTDGVTALVLELVEGPTLADRIAQGAIPLDEALPIAKQIAEALEAAHEQGIIHRDLKPANIKVRPDGTVKVLDFGLAKALEPTHGGGPSASLANSPTITSPAMMTGVGVILGTAAYMSPEQAKGKPADKRSDIWAFGCVLYEMLSGTRPFDGEDSTEVLGAVVRLEPRWEALPPGVPLPIHALLQACLVKDRRRRVADISTALFVLERSGSLAAAIEGRPAVVAAARTALWRRALPWAVAVGSLLTALMILTRVPSRTTPPRVTRFPIVPPGNAALAIDNNNPDLAVSPDGVRIVFATGVQPDYHWYIRRLDALAATPLSTLPGDAENPFVSPDNAWLGFSDEGGAPRRLIKVPIAGGPVVTICEVMGGNVRGADWGPDDVIVFGTSTTGLWRVPARGGKAEALTRPSDGSLHYFPKFLPGGRAVLFTIMPASGNTANAQIAVVNLSTGAQTVLIPGASYARYSPSGHLIYGAGGTLRAVGFDLDRLVVTTGPVPVVDDVVTKNVGGVADFDVVSDGSLVYVAGAYVNNPPRTLVWLDRDGRDEPINVPPHAYAYARLSPDGTHVALDARDAQSDIWIWDVVHRTLQRLTNDPGINRLPIWTPDGKRVAFSADRDGLESVYWQAFDGSGTMERLSGGTQIQAPNSFSPDGTQLIFQTPTQAPFDLGVISITASPRTATMLLQSPFNESNAEVSPDGRWLAYQSSDSGRDEIYVRPFPKVDTARRPVSTGGGTRPLWSRNGRELFYYVAPDTIMSASVQPGADITFGNPQPVVKGRYATPFYNGRHYDVSVDGQRFLLLKDVPPPDGQVPPAPEIHVVLNWFEELRAKAPTSSR